jgi:hypothetical protein
MLLYDCYFIGVVEEQPLVDVCCETEFLEPKLYTRRSRQKTLHAESTTGRVVKMQNGIPIVLNNRTIKIFSGISGWGIR